MIGPDGVPFCGRCEELLPMALDLAIPLLLRAVARLDRRVTQLVERLGR